MHNFMGIYLLVVRIYVFYYKSFNVQNEYSGSGESGYLALWIARIDNVMYCTMYTDYERYFLLNFESTTFDINLSLFNLSSIFAFFKVPYLKRKNVTLL